MSPSTAIILWLTLLLTLLWGDPARRPGSLARWTPLIWLSIVASRLPSQWLGVGQIGQTTATAYEEGNSLDRTIYLILMLFAGTIVIRRSVSWRNVVARRLPLIALLAYALCSALWSDFPFVAFKRWFRDLGIYLTVLVIWTDPEPVEALRTVLRRLCFAFVPLSIVLNKYYPDIGRQYEFWSGTTHYVGATTSKNMLGLLCLVSGLYFVWDTFERLANRQGPRAKRIILVNTLFIGMTLWLLDLAESATAMACLAFGTAMLVLSRATVFRRWPALLMAPIPAALGLATLMSSLNIDLAAVIAPLLGRDPTLTDRTLIWNLVRGLQTSPILGAGYESFWMGSRLETIWQSSVGMINHAHNGYLQVYLNLGVIGVVLLTGVLLHMYRQISHQLKALTPIGSFACALWSVLLVYNITESAFLGGILWTSLLMTTSPLSDRSLDDQSTTRAPERKRVKLAARSTAHEPHHRGTPCLEAQNDHYAGRAGRQRCPQPVAAVSPIANGRSIWAPLSASPRRAVTGPVAAGITPSLQR
jgi:exopolysaccharide production protein ExoQ